MGERPRLVDSASFLVVREANCEERRVDGDAVCVEEKKMEAGRLHR
jgi:hypothetical protein